MTDTTPRPKIAILGGGPSALSAAFNLTSQADWQDRYEVTVYQMGWRLGGKCATGRDPESKRIQEHGIHLFGGFYRNTFEMVRDAYGALYGADGRLRADEPIRTVNDAFVQNSYLMYTERWKGRVVTHDLWPPENDRDPWESVEDVPMETVLVEILDAMLTTLTDRKVDESAGQRARLRRLVSLPFVSIATKRLERLAEGLVAGHRDAEVAAARAARAMQRVVRLLGPLLSRWDSTRWKIVQIDLLTALLRGVLDDRLLEGNLDAIDGLTDREWLARHGASRLVLDSTLPQMVSNICFEYEGGDSTNGPAMSARAFVSFQLRGLVGKGRSMYYFRAGTGESIVSPLYRVLRERGVRFEFFHKVTGLSLSADGSTVEEIAFNRQATPVGEYEPTFLHAGLYCWPDQPDWDQLQEGPQLRAMDESERAAGRGPLDLESWWCPWTGTPSTLRRGVDFDDVVLAIPIGALPYIAGEVIDHQRHAPVWRPMIDHVKTAPTQHVQVWMDRPLSELGWERPLRFGSATWLLPFTDVVDLTDLMAYEDWPADDSPRSLLYFCGPMQQDDPLPPFSDHGYPQRARDRVSATAAAWLRSLHHLLPGTSATPYDLDTFDFGVLHVPRSAGPLRSEDRLRVQHIKANVDPNERYVLSLPGSNQYRLSAWSSGVDNLVLCGDWIDTGLNVGSFEAAVTSGMLASHALTGYPALADVHGYTFLRTPPEPASPRPLWPKR